MFDDSPARTATFRPAADVTERPHLVVVDDAAVAAICSSDALRNSHTVETMSSLDAARSRVKSLHRGILVTALDLADDDATELCRIAKTGSRTVLVLATTTDVTRVPRALLAGCDSVLLKPFAPNLLYARLGRLTRHLKIRCSFPSATLGSTNQHWPALLCPRCGCTGATSFDATSLRRVWYACLACEHVWIGKRQE